MSKASNCIYEFGPFRLDPSERLLLRDGVPIALTPKAFETLVMLVENSGHLVDKDALIERVWPDTFVEDGSLTRNISVLRRLLGGDSADSHYIETLPKRGYRFVADVREPQDDSSYVIVNRRARLRIVTEEVMAEPGTESSLTVKSKRLMRSRPFILGLSLFILAVVVGVAYLWASSRAKRAEPKAPLRSMAVLPFKDSTSDGSDEYLGLGLADALITRLGTVKQLIVRPTSAVLKYAGQNEDAVLVGKELGVDSVLEGSIQKSGERIRIRMQLMSARDGTPVWTGRFEAKFEDVFTIEDSISESVTTALVLKLTEEQRRSLVKRYTENAEAYQLYLKGRYYWNKRRPEWLEKAIENFNKAIEKDPEYALAYSGLADCYLAAGSLQFSPPKEIYPKAKQAASKAVEIDDLLGEAHTSLASVKWEYDWEWADAESEFQRALELSPNDATMHQCYSEYLMAMGREAEALAEIRRAQELDPLSLIINSIGGFDYYFAHQYDQAIEQCKQTLDMDPNFYLAHLYLAASFEEKGMLAEAIAEAEKVKTIIGRAPPSLMMLGRVYASASKRNESLRTVTEMKKMAAQIYVDPFYVAMVYASLGDSDQLFEWLEKSLQDRSYWLSSIRVNPMLDHYRSDPRYDSLLRRVGLTP